MMHSCSNHALRVPMDVEVLSNPLHIGGLWGTLPKVDASI